jgi:hypothetical protein
MRGAKGEIVNDEICGKGTVVGLADARVLRGERAIRNHRKAWVGRSLGRVEPEHGQPGAFVPSPALESTFAFS